MPRITRRTQQVRLHSRPSCAAPGLENAGRHPAFLDDMPYISRERPGRLGRSCGKKTAHCLEGAIFAAAARARWISASHSDLEGTRIPTTSSQFSNPAGMGRDREVELFGCRYREPVTARSASCAELTSIFTSTCGASARFGGIQRPVNLARFDPLTWATTKDIWFIAEIPLDISHRPLLKRGMGKHLTRIDPRTKKVKWWVPKKVGFVPPPDPSTALRSARNDKACHGRAMLMIGPR